MKCRHIWHFISHSGQLFQSASDGVVMSLKPALTFLYLSLTENLSWKTMSGGMSVQGIIGVICNFFMRVQEDRMPLSTVSDKPSGDGRCGVRATVVQYVGVFFLSLSFPRRVDT